MVRASFFFIFAAVVIAIAAILFMNRLGEVSPQSVTPSGQNIAMKLTSSAFSDGGSIPSQYTCDGNNAIPPLSFSEIPEDTVSLALLMDDPDVPKTLRPDGVFDHWVVYNMSPDIGGIREGTVPTGVQGVNTRGDASYTGPCPPDREHRYFFRLYALDAELHLPSRATKADVLAAMEGHILDTAELMGRYERN